MVAIYFFIEICTRNRKSSKNICFNICCQYWHSFGDQHASSETDIPHRRHIGDQHAHWRCRCLIGYPLKTDMPLQRPIGMGMLDQCMSIFDWSPIRHVGIWWDMFVRHFFLRFVFNEFPILIIFLWTPKLQNKNTKTI